MNILLLDNIDSVQPNTHSLTDIYFTVSFRKISSKSLNFCLYKHCIEGSSIAGVRIMCCHVNGVIANDVLMLVLIWIHLHNSSRPSVGIFVAVVRSLRITQITNWPLISNIDLWRNRVFFSFLIVFLDCLLLVLTQSNQFLCKLLVLCY